MKYIGEGPREMYWEDSNGKWHHALGNGKSFDTMEEAKKDYDSQGHVGCVGYIFFGIIIILKMLCGKKN